MSFAKRNSSSTSVCTLDLACNLLRLKHFPSKRYLIGIPLSPSWKASVSMAENIMLNSVEAITQPCLTPFATGNGLENSPLFWTVPGRFARESFRPWVVSPLFGGSFRPCFFIKAPRLEPGHVWRYLRWPGLSHDNF